MYERNTMSIKINIGCGDKPTSGWRNYDNSWSLRLARVYYISYIFYKLGFISRAQYKFIYFLKNTNIVWANATKLIPESDSSVDVLYSSHMLEHLERNEALSFLKEVRRILKSGGIVRLAVPDLKCQIENYIENQNADIFIKNTLLTRKKPTTIGAMIQYLIIGDRNHQWMYDGKSLCMLLYESGFREPSILDAGSTTIQDPGMLDLKERSPGTVYVEAFNP